MFEKTLLDEGYKVKWMSDHFGEYCFENEEYTILICEHDGITKLYVNETFEMMALPDYEFKFIPYTKGDYQKMLISIKK